MKSRLQFDSIDYIEVSDILDVAGRAMGEEVSVVYMYDRGDLVLNGEPMSRSAVKLFEAFLSISGVVLFFVKEMI